MTDYIKLQEIHYILSECVTTFTSYNQLRDYIDTVINSRCVDGKTMNDMLNLPNCAYAKLRIDCIDYYLKFHPNHHFLDENDDLHNCIATWECLQF